jgi:hypothetical protein
LLGWCYPHVEKHKRWHRTNVHRAARRFAVNVRRGWWAPNAELLRLIRGE